MTAFRAIGATTFLAPLPAVLVSCCGREPGFDRENMLTVAWAGVVNSDPPMVSVSIRKERHSHAQIRQSGAFCVNLTTQALCRATDYCGVTSGPRLQSASRVTRPSSPVFCVSQQLVTKSMEARYASASG